MKLLLQIIILTSMFAVSACNVYLQKKPQRTSAARAAYGNAAPKFKANKKKNQKRKREAVKSAKRKKVRSKSSYFEARPY